MEFLKLVADLEKGKTADELNAALAEVVAGVQLTGKKGSVTLKITVEPADKSAEVLGIESDIKANPPKADRKLDIFFTNEKGELSRNNARQMTIDDLKKTDAEPASVTHLRKV